MSIADLLKIIDSLPRVMHVEINGEHHQKTYEHTFSPPSDSERIVGELLGKLQVPFPIIENELQPLYQIANGMKLFHSESDNVESGRYFIPPVELYPLERLAAETAYMQSLVYHEMNMMEEDEPPIYSGGMVIGEAPGTGNPFVLVRWGGLAGKIVYADHDPDENEWSANPFAQSTHDLLKQIALPPHPALCHLCGADKIWF